MKVVWQPKAIASRRVAIARIAQDDPRAALNQLREVLAQTDRLAEYPKMGRSGRRQNTRELSIARTPFVVMYRIRPRAQRVEVMYLIHTRQNWQG